jgi:peptidoglycan/xylan/chitin deacetylase (PgdA/CDA1 family)
VVEIDTTGGPGFGFEHFKSHDFLREGEVVLTFDDGPWPKNTPAVLAALAAHCTKAIFFPIGLHATYEPGILKQVAAAGHAVGSHTWCHQDLSKTKSRCNVNGKVQTVEYNPKDEIEMGISAVHWAVGGPTAPYFRFPGAATAARAHRLSRQAQHRDLLNRHGFIRLQNAQAGAGQAVGDGKIEEAWQGHRAGARFPTCYGRGRDGSAQ